MSPPFDEGTCVNNGNRLVVAHGRSALRLRSLTAVLKDFRVAEQLGRAIPQQGVFMLIRLEVQNRASTPARFAAGQTVLSIAGQRFDERTDVEEEASAALAFKGRAPIQPGRTAEGTVIYDIPTAQIERVTREGELLIVNFDGNPRGRMPEFGQFRIYRE